MDSLAESDSFDADSAFEDQEVSEVGATVTKFVSRFVDKVCTESGVSSDHIKALHQMVPGKYGSISLCSLASLVVSSKPFEPDNLGSNPA